MCTTVSKNGCTVYLLQPSPSATAFLYFANTVRSSRSYNYNMYACPPLAIPIPGTSEGNALPDDAFAVLRNEILYAPPPFQSSNTAIRNTCGWRDGKQNLEQQQLRIHKQLVYYNICIYLQHRNMFRQKLVNKIGFA